MGLWLKCPHCLTTNPLDLNSCAKCGASLTNLPAAKRVYVYDQKAPAAPKPAAAKPAGTSPRPPSPRSTKPPPGKLRPRKKPPANPPPSGPRAANPGRKNNSSVF